MDVTGSTLPNATVTVGPFRGLADATGNFRIHVSGLSVGTSAYPLEVQAVGYDPTIQTISLIRNQSPAAYKASAASIAYNQLTKDPAALKGRVVVYTAQVFQYDTNTTTSHFIASVTNEGYGFWTDHIWVDVDPTAAQHVCKDTLVKLWGDVVGPYTYTTTSNGQLTIPEIHVAYVDVISNGC